MEPSLNLLTGPDAGELLQAAVDGAGGRVLAWRATYVDHRPGRATSVGYAVRVAWGEHERDETFAARAGRGAPAAEGVLTLSDGEREVALWRYPADPYLPALPAAGDPVQVRLLLRDLGLLGDDVAAHDVALTTRAYRPGRRAVIEASFPHGASMRGRLFLKVVRPDRIADLHRRHGVLYDAGVPVPRPLGWTDAGLLVLSALPGGGLHHRLCAEGPAAVAPQDLVAALDALPDELLSLRRRPSWTDGAEHYAGVLGAALPACQERAADLAGRIVEGLRDVDEPVVPVHGDFYEGQLLAAGGRLTGLLDVDSAGPGHRTDDLGCLLAHLDVLAQIAQRDGQAEQERLLREAAAAWLPVLDAGGCDRRALRLRTAGVLLSLATGPHRVQQPDWPDATGARLDLVEAWVRRAEQV